MSILVIAEHDNRALSPATQSAIAAAQQLGPTVHLLVAGHDAGGVADAGARVSGVDKVLWADAPCLRDSMAENLAALVASLSPSYSHVLAASTANGKNFMPRAAALLDVQPISDVVAIRAADTFVRPVYAGNALMTVRSCDAIKVMTVRTTAFDAACAGAQPAPVEPIPAPADSGLSTLLGRETSASERPDLNAAAIVVSGGRGVASAEGFSAVLGPLADRLGAAIGATRAAVDAGYAPNDAQVGQTGKIVAPNLYIAVGISGAIQHLAGMKDSRVIVAVNRDEEAPIFQVADYAVVGDLFEIVPGMVRSLAGTAPQQG